MSSWSKAAKTNQKTHRERHQPANRAHLGILEKKKDYQVRSSDYHEKQDTLKLLRKRALTRNPDEFHFHMINSRVKEGEHCELVKEKNIDTPDQIKLMATQDLKYVTLMHTAEKKKIDRLQSELHILDGANKTQSTHVFFVDSIKEAKKFNVAKHLDTDPALLSRRTNRPRMSDLKKMTLPDPINNSNEIVDKYVELGKRITREKELSTVQQKLQINHLVKKSKTGKKLVSHATKNAPAVYEWATLRNK